MVRDRNGCGNKNAAARVIGPSAAYRGCDAYEARLGHSMATAMDDLLAKLRAGPTGNSEQDRATMHRAAHEVQRLQLQLQDARNAGTNLARETYEYRGKEPVADPAYGWGD